MSSQKGQSSKASGMKFEVVKLNRGSSQAEDSPEQVHLDRIFNFKFIECNVRANQSGAYREDRNEKHLVASDLCERLCTLARMVISYSHLFTLWKNKVHGKRVCDLNIVDKWLSYRVVIGYELIDQGKRFSQNDPIDNDLSEDKEMRAHVKGYTGCGLDDFDKKGERRSVKYKFRNRYSQKAWLFYKSSKFQKDLIQPIRNYIGIVHEDYMKTLRMADWKLDELLDLRNQPFTDCIGTLPLHFKTNHWEILFNHGKVWDRDSQKNILDSIKQLETCRVDPQLKKTPPQQSPSNKKKLSKPVYPSSQKPSHASASAHLSGSTKRVIPQNLQEALQFFYGEMDLPAQAISFYSIPEHDHKRQAITKYTVNEMNRRLASGDFRDTYQATKDEDSDESVGRPRHKNQPKILSKTQEKFILNLHSCLSMHLGFYAPCNDDEWCSCPLSKLANKNWHEAIGFDSDIESQFCSNNNKFGPSDLFCHVREKHLDLLGIGVRIYLGTLFGNEFGQG